MDIISCATGKVYAIVCATFRQSHEPTIAPAGGKTDGGGEAVKSDVFIGWLVASIIIVALAVNSMILQNQVESWKYQSTLLQGAVNVLLKEHSAWKP